MKIINNNASTITNTRAYSNDTIKDQTSASGKLKNSKNFDDIIIHYNNASDTNSDAFINDIKNKIMADVKSPAASYKLNDLKSQIALGEYQINISDIAKKILLN